VSQSGPTLGPGDQGVNKAWNLSLGIGISSGPLGPLRVDGYLVFWRKPYREINVHPGAQV
jgi:hypothetical protein